MQIIAFSIGSNPHRFILSPKNGVGLCVHERVWAGTYRFAIVYIMKLKHEQIQYVEFMSQDLSMIKSFYSDAFGWKFTDYGPEYSAFEGGCVDGGFTVGIPKRGSVLVILYSAKLEETLEKVRKAKGTIVKEIFNFPGGRRFHFVDPDGNELAVWSDT
jgi:hypothetical protein